MIEIFKKMKAYGFDTTGKLKWGFYFVDNDKEKLENVFKELKDNNYILEQIYSNDDDEWTLHASKVDILTPEKLYKRNIAFNQLANYCQITLYDGWDVEKI